jgi:hypothetical protein
MFFLLFSGNFDPPRVRAMPTKLGSRSGIDIAREQGANDIKLCVATSTSDCGVMSQVFSKIKPEMSKEEKDKIIQENSQCFGKSWANTPACVRRERCKQFEAELPSGSDAKP